jgi:glycerophosphoryl diester phosphodiesterase
LQQVFDFVDFYIAYYREGDGKSHPRAVVRARNASQVRFNVETKINPLKDFAARTCEPRAFVRAVADVIVKSGWDERTDVQSFDWRSLREIHRRYPTIGTACLLGDFPIFADPEQSGSDDGANLQGVGSANTPWLAGLFWPYRETSARNPIRARRSAGFEGMASSPDGSKLYPMLERPLIDGPPSTLVIHEFDVTSRRYTGKRWSYPLDPKGEAIGDFILFSPVRGLVIENDGSQGDLSGFKKIFEVQLPAGGGEVIKIRSIDLMKIGNPRGISVPREPGDVGVGATFAMPFVTIESVIVLSPDTIGVLNDNNYPFSVGRHVGTGAPDDNEFIILRLARALGS